MSNNAVSAFRQAFLSRIFFTCLSALSNALIPDHVPDAFIFPFRPERPGDHVVKWIFGGLARWDSHHFVAISQRGYTNEAKFAFFPLFPALITAAREYPLWPIAWLVSSPFRDILAGWILSCTFFCVACAILYVSFKYYEIFRRESSLTTCICNWPLLALDD